MAKVTERIAIGIGDQTAEGTINAVIEGAVTLGTTEAGTVALGLQVRDESLDIDFERLEEDAQEVTGSLTPEAGDFRRVETTFSFDIQLKGAGKATPTGSGDWDLPPAIVDLLAGLGLVQTADGTGTDYDPGVLTFLSFILWRDDQFWELMDCRLNGVFNFIPGEGCILSITVFVGSVKTRGTRSYPASIAYGIQGTHPTTILKNAGAAIGASTKGFVSGTVSINNAYSEGTDSNAATGLVHERASRRFEWSGAFFALAADAGQEYDNLIVTSVVDDLVFAFGTTGADPADGLTFTLANLNITKMSKVEEQNRVIWNLEGYATSPTADAEFKIRSS